LEVLLDQVTAKTVEGEDANPVGLRADKFQQPLPHGFYPRFGEGEAEDVVGAGICFCQDVADAGGEQVRLTRAGASEYHDRAVDLFHGGALRRVEAGELGLEGGIIEELVFQLR